MYRQIGHVLKFAQIKLQKRENVKICVGEQVHNGNNNTKVNSDVEIGCKKCKMF
jgi:hypothetical protein